MHVGPAIPPTMKQTHRRLLWETLNTANLPHALPRYLLYLHLCGDRDFWSMLESLPVRALRILQRSVEAVSRRPTSGFRDAAAPTSLRSIAHQAVPISSTLEKDVVRGLKAVLRRGPLSCMPTSLQLQCRVSSFFILDILLDCRSQGLELCRAEGGASMYCKKAQRLVSSGAETENVQGVRAHRTVLQLNVSQRTGSSFVQGCLARDICEADVITTTTTTVTTQHVNVGSQADQSTSNFRLAPPNAPV